MENCTEVANVFTKVMTQIMTERQRTALQDIPHKLTSRMEEKSKCPIAVQCKENDDYSDLYFDITRGGFTGLSDESESDLESKSLPKKAEISDIKTVKVKQEDSNLTKERFGEAKNIERNALHGDFNKEIAHLESLSSDCGNKVKCEKCGELFSRNSLDTPLCEKCVNSKDEMLVEITNEILSKKNTIEQRKEKHFFKFQCEECGKFFVSKVGLSKHEVVHAGIKEFECEECGECFSRKDRPLILKLSILP